MTTKKMTVKKILISLDAECLGILEKKKEETGAGFCEMIRRAIKKI